MRFDSSLLSNLNPTQSDAESLCVYGGVRHGPLNPPGEDKSGSPRCFQPFWIEVIHRTVKIWNGALTASLQKDAHVHWHTHTQYSQLTCRGRQSAGRVDLSPQATEYSPIYFFEQHLELWLLTDWKASNPLLRGDTQMLLPNSPAERTAWLRSHALPSQE